MVAVDHGDRPAYEMFHDALAQPIRKWRDGRELAAAKAEVRRQRRRQAVLGAVALVLVGLLVAVLALWRHSEDLSRRSESGRLVSQALAEGANPDRSLELAKRAIDEADTPEAMLSVRAALAKPYVERVFAKNVGEPSKVSVAQSANGSLVAIGSPKGGWIWDPRKQKAEKLEGLTAGGNVSFNRDGTRVVSIAWNNVQVFDTRGKPLGVPATPEAGEYFVWAAMDPAGGRLALVPADSQAVRIRSVDDGATVGTLVNDSHVASALWSPDGQSLVTKTEEGTVTVWNQDYTQRGPGFRNVEAYAFSVDGASLAVAGSDHVVHVVRLDDLSPIASFAAGDQIIAYVTFGMRDANLVAAGDFKGTTRVFDLRDPGAEPRVFPTGTATTGIGLAAPPFVITTGAGTVSIWDDSQGVPIETFEISGSIFEPRLEDDGSYTFLQVGWVEKEDGGRRVPRLRLWTGRTGSTRSAVVIAHSAVVIAH